MLTALCAAVALFGVAYGVSCIPRRVVHSYEGIEFWVRGDSETAFLQTVNIHIDGRMRRRLFDPRYTFTGAFEIDAYPYSLSNEVTISLFADGYDLEGLVDYDTIEDGKSVRHSLGVLYTDQQFSSLAINLLDITKLEDGSSAGSHKGRVMAAPARDIVSGQKVLEERNLFWVDYTGLMHFPYPARPFNKPIKD